jgi:hypothetical protein
VFTSSWASRSNEQEPGRDWEGMIAEIFTATLPALVSRLVDEFSAKRRDSVNVRELQEQVARLTAAQNSLRHNLAEVEHVVLILTRYLALTRQDAFALTGDRLVLTEPFRREREAVVAPVMTDFGARVELSIERRQKHIIESFRRQQTAELVERDEQATDSADRFGTARTSRDFLESFAEEVLDMRLGRE